MDPFDSAEPVAKERPMRGREMHTKIIPTDMFETMRIVTAKKEFGKDDLMKEMLQTKRPGDAEMYHKGYVGGQPYLVPDTNLEMMKNIVNMRTKKKPDTKYVKDTVPETEEDAYRRYQKRLQLMYDKLQDYSSGEEEEEVEPEPEEEAEAEPEPEEEEEPIVEEEELSAEEEEPVGDEELIEEEEPVAEEEPVVEEEQEPEPGRDYLILPYPREPRDELEPLRFLISGHFRGDLKPIFIIQQYEGQGLFQSKSLDLLSKQTQSNVNIFISGKYYNETILEQSADYRPVSLNVEPKRILIDRRSRVYEERFTDVFTAGEYDIEFVGKYIKTSSTMYTPLLTIAVNSSQQPVTTSEPESKKTPRQKTKPVAVYTSRIKQHTPFRDSRKARRIHRHESNRSRPVSRTTSSNSSSTSVYRPSTSPKHFKHGDTFNPKHSSANSTKKKLIKSNDYDFGSRKLLVDVRRTKTHTADNGS